MNFELYANRLCCFVLSLFLVLTKRSLSPFLILKNAYTYTQRVNTYRYTVAFDLVDLIFFCYLFLSHSHSFGHSHTQFCRLLHTNWRYTHTHIHTHTICSRFAAVSHTHSYENTTTMTMSNDSLSWHTATMATHQHTLTTHSIRTKSEWSIQQKAYSKKKLQWELPQPATVAVELFALTVFFFVVVLCCCRPI